MKAKAYPVQWPNFFNSSCIQGSLLLLVDELEHEFILFFPPVPVIASLEIDPVSMAAFGASFDANFPLKTPLNIQAIDAIGEVITDGPDSILVRRQYSLTKQHSLLCVHLFLVILSPSHLLLPALLRLSCLSKSQWRQTLPQPAFPMTALSSLFTARQCSQDPSVHPLMMCS